MSEVIELKKETAEETTGQTYIDLVQGLYSVQDLPGRAFAEKVLQNIKKLEIALKPVNDAFQPTKEFEVFAQKVQNEAQGDPEKTKLLEETEPGLVAERTAQVEAGQAHLEAPMTVKLYNIPKNSLPANITARQLRSLELILY